MNNFVTHQSKFQKIAVKDVNFLNLITSQEKRIDKIYKKLVDSNSTFEETRRHLKPVGARPIIMYGFCKVHKKCFNGCPPFSSIIPTFQASTYKLAKYLVPVLEPLTTTSCNFMGSLIKIHFLLTSPLKKPSKFALTFFLETITLFMAWKKVNWKIFSNQRVVFYI